MNRENLWDRYVCVRCVRTTSFLSLFVSFFDKRWPIIFFPPGREGIGVLTQLVWGEVGARIYAVHG